MAFFLLFLPDAELASIHTHDPVAASVSINATFPSIADIYPVQHLDGVHLPERARFTHPEHMSAAAM